MKIGMITEWRGADPLTPARALDGADYDELSIEHEYPMPAALINLPAHSGRGARGPVS